ncbi:MAG: DUF5063 domain-containing protein [Bacteroidota bacterium]
MTEELHDYVYSTEVLEFVKKCKYFTDLVDSALPEERKELVIELLKILPGLYSDMIGLPVREPVLDAGNEKIVTEEKWSEVFQKLAANLGSQNEYIDIPEEEEFDRLDVISRELSEDIADIYQDLKDFIEIFRLGTEEVMNDVLWECRINFENYWGTKLLRASLHLHKIMIRDEDVLEKMDREYEEKSSRKIRADEWHLTKRQNEIRDDGEIQS